MIWIVSGGLLAFGFSLFFLIWLGSLVFGDWWLPDVGVVLLWFGVLSSGAGLIGAIYALILPVLQSFCG